MFLAAMLKDAFHAALEHAIEIFDGLYARCHGRILRRDGSRFHGFRTRGRGRPLHREMTFAQAGLALGRGTILAEFES